MRYVLRVESQMDRIRCERLMINALLLELPSESYFFDSEDNSAA